MANVLILGGGFAGVVAAERLAKTLGTEHQITLVSREDRFTFYPALVRLAFGKCEPDDISYDLRGAMLDRRVSFIRAEVARVEPYERRVLLAGGDVAGDLAYDYLVFALGRRLATERVTGFFEHAHHLLTVESALRFGEAVKGFHKGRALVGYCEGSRLTVPVYETAFALSRMLEERGEREAARITFVSSEPACEQQGGAEMTRALADALDAHDIERLPDFNISKVAAKQVQASDGRRMSYDLLMLVPPFRGAPAVLGTGVTDEDGYIEVDAAMRVRAAGRMYAAGDCVNFSGPKMGHMAVRQAEVVAANVASEIAGLEPQARYEHEMMLVVDEGGHDSIYLHKGLWDGGEESVRRGRFWGWAKRMQERFWEYRHS